MFKFSYLTTSILLIYSYFFFCRMDIAKKKDKDKVIENRKKAFLNSKERFEAEIIDCDQRIKAVVQDIVNPEVLRPKVEELIQLEGRLSRVNALRDDLQKNANLLLKEDESSILEVQNNLTGILHRWDSINDRFAQETELYNNLQQGVTGFSVIKNETVNLLADFEKNLSQITKLPNDLPEAYAIKGKLKDLQTKLANNKNYFDKLNNTGKNIILLSKDIPNFNTEDIETNTKTITESYQGLADAVKSDISALDAEIVLWQQIEEAQGQLLPWLQETNVSLPNLLDNVGDVKEARVKLKTFEEQLKNHEALKNSVITKRDQLMVLHKNQPIPKIESLISTLEEWFKQLNISFAKMSSAVESCESEETALKSDLKVTMAELNVVRDKLNKCDDASGGVGSLVERLKICRIVQADLDGLKPKIATMEKCKSEIVSVNPQYVNSDAIKEVDACKKRHADLSSLLLKIQNVLQMSVAKDYEEKLKTLQDALTIYKNRVAVCMPEDNCDQEQLSSKLLALKDVEKDFPVLEKKKIQLEKTTAVLNDSNLKESIVKLIPEEQRICKEIDLVKEKNAEVIPNLTEFIDLVKNYETNYASALTELNALDDKLNVKGRDLIDINNIPSYIEKFNDVQENCSAQSTRLEELVQMSSEIAKYGYKPKISSIEVLREKLSKIGEYVKNRLNKLNQLDDRCHKFEEKIDAVEKFITDADSQLDEFDSSIQHSQNAEEMKNKLKALKDFANVKQTGVTLLNDLNEWSENLLLEAVPENRNALRTKLKNLRSSVDKVGERWTALLKKVESAALQRASIEDSKKQILQWIVSVENGISPQLELKNTLPEKKKLLSTYRAALQDVLTHKPIIEQLVQKIKSVPYESDAENLPSRYQNLEESLSKAVNILEKQVSNHEVFLNNFEKLKDFTDVLQSEESKCCSCDVDGQLAIYENIILQKDVGNAMITECTQNLKPVLSETADTGRAAITSEFDNHKQIFITLVDKCQGQLTDLKVKRDRAAQLEDRTAALDEFLKTVEAKLRDQSLKNSLSTKKAYLKDMEKILEDIEQRSKDYVAFKKEASDITPELAETAQKLFLRYQNAKTKAKVSNGFCTIFVEP